MSTEPYLTSFTCTDPACNGSCGRIGHPYAAVVTADDRDEEEAA